MVARILTQHKLVDVPVNVVNKPGGSGTIGLNYLNQHPGDPHYIIIGDDRLDQQSHHGPDPVQPHGLHAARDAVRRISRA